MGLGSDQLYLVAAHWCDKATYLSILVELIMSRVRPYSATCLLAFVLQPGHRLGPTKARVLAGIVQACMVTPMFQLMSLPVVRR